MKFIGQQGMCPFDFTWLGTVGLVWNVLPNSIDPVSRESMRLFQCFLLLKVIVSQFIKDFSTPGLLKRPESLCCCSKKKIHPGLLRRCWGPEMTPIKFPEGIEMDQMGL